MFPHPTLYRNPIQTHLNSQTQYALKMTPFIPDLEICNKVPKTALRLMVPMLQSEQAERQLLVINFRLMGQKLCYIKRNAEKEISCFVTHFNEFRIFLGMTNEIDAQE